jgi:hypothetical protein
MSRLLGPVEPLFEGKVSMFAVIEIIEISILEDDEAAYGFGIKYFGFCCIIAVNWV